MISSPIQKKTQKLLVNVEFGVGLPLSLVNNPVVLYNLEEKHIRGIIFIY